MAGQVINRGENVWLVQGGTAKDGSAEAQHQGHQHRGCREVGTQEAHLKQNSASGEAAKSKIKSFVLLVRMRGLEPPLPRENQILSLARLPVSPHPHSRGAISALRTEHPQDTIAPQAAEWSKEMGSPVNSAYRTSGSRSTPLGQVTVPESESTRTWAK